MKIEVEVPDEFIKEDTNLYIFCGMNHLAVKRPDTPWVIKKVGCSMCGSCCESTHIQGMKLPVGDDGVCKMLTAHPKQEGKRYCAWGSTRPFACCIGSPSFEPKCSIKWEFEK